MSREAINIIIIIIIVGAVIFNIIVGFVFVCGGVRRGLSIELGEVLLVVDMVGQMSCCCSTGCLSCQGKQSTSSSSSSGRSLLLFLIVFSILLYEVFFRFSVAGRASVGDSMRLLQLGTAVGRDTMAVGVEYHGGLGGMGLGSAMVTLLLY